jgi:hypothetical protein
MTGNWQKLTVCSVVSLPDLRSIVNILSISDHYTYSGSSVALYLLLPCIIIVVLFRLMEYDGKKFNVFELGDQAGHHSIAPLPV